ncbi:MAG: 50S rRNA methyltransferase [Chlamydiae bacterium CG10_big_fil_rev_8_21_14_0_10_42_34]|nr:MAG: 50S rRNA methyltransferase [Chlamydiae bacterium CG10_big_fil_rev_8_21_14_0_10_42_34]
MFKVKVLTIGKCKEKWLSSALLEYEKRLKGKLSMEWILAKDDTQLTEMALKESFIALDPKGTLLSSEQWCEKMMTLGLRLVFVIGGAVGLSEQLKKHAQFIWSLSPLTFTHQITRLILAEQLYRATEIERGSQYHK